MIHAFYLIIDDVSWLERLIRHGLRFVQLRLKDKEPEEIHRQIALARFLTQKHGIQLVVNDYWQQALDLDCDFVHLGQEDLDGADIPTLRRFGVKLGISTHDDAELDRALSLDPDYVALGPVYPTSLKIMPWAPQGLSKVSEWKAKIGSIPLVAIGGLTLERAEAVFDAGADSIAVVSDVLTHIDPEARLREWLSFTS